MARRDDEARERFDERDTMFARAERRPGTEPYRDYYRRRPELREVDDRIRAMPSLWSPLSRYYDEEVTGEARRLFDEIPDLEPEAEAVARFGARLAGDEPQTGALKEMALELGAVAAGCAETAEPFVYSHRGRHDAGYGRPIETDLPFALVFLVEMGFDAMQRAPRAPTVRESALQYHRAAAIAKTMAAAIEAAGCRARAHFDACYDVILPPLAVAAGLGELGRNNILVAHRFGSRVRIGAVTTDIELAPDRPRSLGVRAFCARCKKCSDNCPVGALSKGEPERIRGVSKWPTDVERCYAHWRRIGTDCGICMAVCPFSHRDSWFHNLVRRLVRLHPLMARAALYGDDLVYGRRWKVGRK